METPKPRGQYAKGVARREEILDQAVATFGRLGYHAASMREIAASCGLSQAGLLHHFPSKEALLLALVERRDAEQRAYREAASSADWQTEALAVLEANLEQLPLTQLWATLAAEATDPNHPAHAYFVERYRGTVAGFAPRFGETDRDTAEIKARLLTAMWDGLQLQALLDPEFDMRPAFQAALQMIAE